MFGKKNSKNKKAAAKPQSKQKLQSRQQPKPKMPQVTPNWLYMNPQGIGLADIGKAVDPVRYPEVHLWAEMGVLEIEVAEKASVDFEAMECDLEDEVGNAFLAAHGIKTLVMITIVPAAWEASRALMTEICTRCGGFFCGDTEDFTPVVEVMQIAGENNSEDPSGTNA